MRILLALFLFTPAALASQASNPFTLAVLHNVQVSWTSSPTPTVNGYNVYRGTASGHEALLTGVGDMTSYADTAVTPGQTYYYYVTAVILCNGVVIAESGPSNEVSATVPSP